MPDMAYSNRADELLSASGANALTVAHAHAQAVLATAKAIREMDSRLKYIADTVAGSVTTAAERPEPWVVYTENGVRTALNVDHVTAFRENADGGTDVALITDPTATLPIPLSFGEVALQVGA